MTYWAVPLVITLAAISVAYPLLRKALFTQALVIANFVVFLALYLAIMFQPDFFSKATLQIQLYTELAFNPSHIELASTSTLLTSLYVHGSALHLFGNMLILYLIGVPLEERIKIDRTMTIYFAAGLAGSAAFYATHQNSFVFVVGASGAISGLMGGLLILYPKLEIPMFLGPLFLHRVPVWIAVGLAFAFETLLTFSGQSDGIAHEAHVAGMITGIFLAPALVRREVPRISALSRAIDLSSLATTPQLRAIYKTYSSENVPEVRQAWLEHFVKKARCPKCGGPLQLDSGSIKSECGWRSNT